ncbi:MAG: hypothetical protein ACLFP4_14680 [Spirochaetales bacterium]
MLSIFIIPSQAPTTARNEQSNKKDEEHKKPEKEVKANVKAADLPRLDNGPEQSCRIL